jgi:hypothetical protein
MGKSQDSRDAAARKGRRPLDPDMPTAWVPPFDDASAAALAAPEGMPAEGLAEALNGLARAWLLGELRNGQPSLAVAERELVALRNGLDDVIGRFRGLSPGARHVVARQLRHWLRNEGLAGDPLAHVETMLLLLHTATAVRAVGPEKLTRRPAHKPAVPAHDRELLRGLAELFEARNGHRPSAYRGVRKAGAGFVAEAFERITGGALPISRIGRV